MFLLYIFVNTYNNIDNDNVGIIMHKLMVSYTVLTLVGTKIVKESCEDISYAIDLLLKIVRKGDAFVEYVIERDEFVYRRITGFEEWQEIYNTHKQGVENNELFKRYKDLTYKGLHQFKQLLLDNHFTPNEELSAILNIANCDNFNTFNYELFKADIYVYENNTSQPIIAHYILSDYSSKWGIDTEVFTTLNDLKQSLLKFWVCDDSHNYMILSSGDLEELTEAMTESQYDHVYDFRLVTIDSDGQSRIYS